MKKGLNLTLFLLFSLSGYSQELYTLPISAQPSTIKEAKLIHMLLEFQGGTFLYEGTTYRITLPKGLSTREKALGFINFTGGLSPSYPFGPIMLLDGYEGHSSRLYVDKNFNFDLSDDGPPYLLKDGLEGVRISVNNPAAGRGKYETLLRFIHYPSEKHKEMAGQQKADDYPGFKGGSFIRADYWLMETPQNSLVFSALLGSDSVMMALVDYNMNGLYNDKGVDLLLLGDYKTASISDRPGEGRHTLGDSTLLAIEGDFYQLLEVAPGGEYIRIKRASQQAYEQATEGNLSKGARIPDLPFTTLEGQRTSLHEISSGKFVLLDFWGTWCKGCVIQTEKLKRLQDHFHDKLTIVGLNYKDDIQKARQYVAAQQLPWIQGIADKSLIETFLVNKFPYYVLIDPEQKIHSFAISLEEVETLLMATKQ